MNKINNIIFSDLDGTLLDYYTYQSTAASKTLQQLKHANIPIILNTSKTLAEIEIIKQKLGLDTPFIIENGAAIYIPIGTFTTQPMGTVVVDNYWVKSFCFPRQYWLNLLSKHTDEFAPFYQGFSTLSDSILSTLTGLTLSEAKRAKQRQYGEPIQWLGDKATKRAFVHHMLDLGANVVQGGRFLHIGGYCDKGQALLWLAEQYREFYLEAHQEINKNAPLCTIALGDGENDVPMLEAADIAVQVRSPVHEFPNLSRQYKTLQTTLYGPEGWAEAIQTILANQLVLHSTSTLN